MRSTIFALSTSLIALAAISATSAIAAVPGDMGNTVVERGRQAQPGDDRGGGRQPQPGDDRGGRNLETPKPAGKMILSRHGADDVGCDDHGSDACQKAGDRMVVARHGADDAGCDDRGSDICVRSDAPVVVGRRGADNTGADDRGGQRPRGTRIEPGDDRGAGR